MAWQMALTTVCLCGSTCSRVVARATGFVECSIDAIVLIMIMLLPVCNPILEAVVQSIAVWCRQVALHKRQATRKRLRFRACSMNWVSTS